MQVLSLGAQLELWRARAGSVHSVFRNAVNLLVEGEMWSVLGDAGHDSPFGIRVAVGDRRIGFGMRVADPVHVRGGWMRVGSLLLDCRTAPRWTPLPWRELAAGLQTRMVRVESAARLRAWTGSAAIAAELADALLAASEPRLEAVVRRSIGRGPGLTPAGDDVMVGMLTAFRCGGGAAGRQFAERLAHALAPALPGTTDLSRHLLGQAARGWPGRTIHELGRTLFEGATEEVARKALDAVLDTGATSGADACLGLASATRCLFPLSARAAA